MVQAAADPSLTVEFDRATKMYQPGEMVGGTISLKNMGEQQVQFERIELEMEAYMDTVSMIRGNLGRPALPKEKRIYFLSKTACVAENGLIFSGGDPVTFSVKLESTTDNQLIDSYVGVDFSIIYKANVTMKRKNEAKPLEASEKFNCRVPGGGILPELGRRFKPQDFSITPDALMADPKN